MKDVLLSEFYGTFWKHLCPKKSTTEIKYQAQTWLQVQLHGRRLGVPNQLTNAAVRITKAPINPGETVQPGREHCGQLGWLDEVTTRNYWYEIKCPAPVTGRYVIIQETTPELLTLAEIEIFIAQSCR